MASDVDVSPQNTTPRKMRANDDGSYTPYVISEEDNTSGYNASGTISTQNLNPNSGVATPLSAVELDLPDGDASTLSIQTVGVYTGVLSIQVCLDGVHWITVGGATAITNLNTAAQTATIASALQSIFQMDISGFPQVRVTALAAVTGSVVVTLIGTQSTGLVALDAPVSLAALPALVAGSALVGAVAIGTGTTVARSSTTAAASTNATSVKSSAGKIGTLILTNYAAYTTFFKIYNKASAPTVGTDIPVATIPVPTVSSLSVPFGVNGLLLDTGIAFAMTKLMADTDTTVLVAGDLKQIMTYV